MNKLPFRSPGLKFSFSTASPFRHTMKQSSGDVARAGGCRAVPGHPLRGSPLTHPRAPTHPLLAHSDAKVPTGFQKFHHQNCQSPILSGRLTLESGVTELVCAPSSRVGKLASRTCQGPSSLCATKLTARLQSEVNPHPLRNSIQLPTRHPGTLAWHPAGERAQR